MSFSGVELSIIVPTFNEKDNVVELVRRLDGCLGGINWEVIFVDDDSPDGTAEKVRYIGRQDIRVRCIQRIDRRGLSSACIEGMLASSAPYLAVMDGDMQHDEELLPEMIATLKSSDIDVVIGSRYTTGGGVGDWDLKRAGMSKLATNLSKLSVKAELTDPMSGFFMIRRVVFAECVRKTSGIGFKILLDLFASSPNRLRFKEIPYHFKSRLSGRSKLDSSAAWDYGMLLMDKIFGHIIPVRFISFCLVGTLGIGIHLFIFYILFKALKSSFISSQIVATIFAITFNFILNNTLTYRDMRLRGWQLLRGWASFTLACSLGAFANVGIASYLFQIDTRWILSALAGILISVVWNYAVTLVYTWNTPRAN